MPGALVTDIRRVLGSRGGVKLEDFFEIYLKTTGRCLEMEEPELRAVLALLEGVVLEVAGGEVQLLGRPGPPDLPAEVKAEAGKCLGGWAKVVAVEGAKLWLQLESSWEGLEAALETRLGAGREDGMVLRPEEVVAGRAVACLDPRTAAWRRGRVLRPLQSGSVDVLLLDCTFTPLHLYHCRADRHGAFCRAAEAARPGPGDGPGDGRG